MMERLTIRNSDGSVSQPINLDWDGALRKLAAYEDTGLTPERVKALNDAGRLTPKAPVFKHGQSCACVDYADGHGETKVTKWAEWTCPKCGWFVGEQYVPRKHNQRKCNFCSQCGQAIDWKHLEQNFPKEG